MQFHTLTDVSRLYIYFPVLFCVYIFHNCTELYCTAWVSTYSATRVDVRRCVSEMWEAPKKECQVL